MPTPSGISYLVENIRTRNRLVFHYCLLLLVVWSCLFCFFPMLRKFLISLQEFKMHELGRIRWLLSSQGDDEKAVLQRGEWACGQSAGLRIQTSGSSSSSVTSGKSSGISWPAKIHTHTWSAHVLDSSCTSQLGLFTQLTHGDHSATLPLKWSSHMSVHEAPVYTQVSHHLQLHVFSTSPHSPIFLPFST